MKHIFALILLTLAFTAAAQTPIKGASELTESQITAYIQARNPSYDPAITAEYLKQGQRYGIRGDIAICQAILETGWFRYEGSSVAPEDHNYCGLGVVGGGVKGNGFPTLQEGVLAHIQHLFAYCATRDLPQRERLIDPRFKFVTRGIATTWEDLSNRWAMNPEYGSRILSIYNNIAKSPPLTRPPLRQQPDQSH